VEVLLGCNGFVWVGARSAATGEGELPELPERTAKEKTIDTTRLFVSRARRERVCRVANAVRVLSALFLAIHPPAIEDVTRCSMEWGTDPKDMLGDAFLRRTLERETERRRAKGGA
jgi:exosome complex component RRP4